MVITCNTQAKKRTCVFSYGIVLEDMSLTRPAASLILGRTTSGVTPSSPSFWHGFRSAVLFFVSMSGLTCRFHHNQLPTTDGATTCMRKS